MTKELFLVNSTKKAKLDDEDYQWAKSLSWYITKNGVATPVLTPDGFKLWMYQHDLVAARAGMINDAPFAIISPDEITDWDYDDIKFIPLNNWAEVEEE